VFRAAIAIGQERLAQVQRHIAQALTQPAARSEVVALRLGCAFAIGKNLRPWALDQALVIKSVWHSIRFSARVG
jgi:hypothetical protein